MRDVYTDELFVFTGRWLPLDGQSSASPRILPEGHRLGAACAQVSGGKGLQTFTAAAALQGVWLLRGEHSRRSDQARAERGANARLADQSIKHGSRVAPKRFSVDGCRTYYAISKHTVLLCIENPHHCVIKFVMNAASVIQPNFSSAIPDMYDLRHSLAV